MSEQQIGPGTQVTLHFAIKLEDGQLVDSNFETAPATFTVGDGKLLPGFEQALFGMAEGEKGILRIMPEQGFGMPNPSNVQTIPRNRFSEMDLQPGLVVSFADAANGELPGVVQAIESDQVKVDFNHPLAGRTIYFDVEILKVQPA
ncbi:MAG: peptidylprolyl isomerase [Motiliproteus sp.]|nr:peptidylprolyl isomerase [Motiliproteus sp.]MCW9052318.1 peptidylprolyl isomerase [Motiliproteus sp.]